jgi:hypothetical protein
LMCLADVNTQQHCMVYASVRLWAWASMHAAMTCGDCLTGDLHKTVVGSDVGSTANTKWSRGGEHAQSHGRTHWWRSVCVMHTHPYMHAGGVFPSTTACHKASQHQLMLLTCFITACESTAAAGGTSNHTLPSNELIVHAALMMLGVQAG